MYVQYSNFVIGNYDELIIAIHWTIYFSNEDQIISFSWIKGRLNVGISENTFLTKLTLKNFSDMSVTVM